MIDQTAPAINSDSLPSAEWFSDQVCHLRNLWHILHEAKWLEDSQSNPDCDEFIGRKLRERLTAYLANPYNKE